MYKDALALCKEFLGHHHPHVATSLNNLAGLYKNQGRYTEAEPLYIEAVAIAEETLGVDHPHTVILRDNLAMLRNAQYISSSVSKMFAILTAGQQDAHIPI